jgi:hypothetical protein
MTKITYLIPLCVKIFDSDGRMSFVPFARVTKQYKRKANPGLHSMEWRLDRPLYKFIQMEKKPATDWLCIISICLCYLFYATFLCSFIEGHRRSEQSYWIVLLRKITNTSTNFIIQDLSFLCFIILIQSKNNYKKFTKAIVRNE